MGPDHSQLEIFNESKHGVLFAAQKDQMRLDAPPQDPQYGRHVCTDLRDLSYEQAGGHECDA